MNPLLLTDICVGYDWPFKIDFFQAKYLSSVYDNKGYILNELREYEEALECFEKALELNPENNSVWKIKLYATLHLGLKKR